MCRHFDIKLALMYYVNTLSCPRDYVRVFRSCRLYHAIRKNTSHYIANNTVNLTVNCTEKKIVLHDTF